MRKPTFPKPSGDFLQDYLDQLDIMISVNEYRGNRKLDMFKNSEGELRAITRLIMLLRKLKLRADI